MKVLNYAVLFLAIVIAGCSMENGKNAVSKVEVRKNTAGQFRLFVDGNEFFVKGAGCEGGNVAALAANGGNTFRTWMDQENHPSEQSVLDEAQKHGLKVLMGLEIGRERHGYDYNDEEWVKKQFDTVKAKVMRYKDHPALLAWAVGNEINLGAKNMKVFDAVNQISAMIKEIDGNHPVTTTLAGISKNEADYIKTNCTGIDFLCIQMYGDIVNLEKRVYEAQWDGPFIVSEWGATGHWEVELTEWDVAIEPTSQEKANSFIQRYKNAIEPLLDNCMGSYVFLWGQKQERTPTWYGMFLENGNATETVDAMYYIWNGKWPENRCPTIDSLRLNGQTAYNSIKLKQGSVFNAKAFASDYENDHLRYIWEIIPESADLGWGGDFEKRPESYLVTEGSSEIKLNTPEKPGAYRLFVYITDEGNKSATANLPFFVD